MKNLVVKEDVPNKEMLDQAMYWFTRRHSFFGALLQEINMKYSNEFPTACVYYEPKFQEYNMVINPKFFEKDLKLEERIGVIKHEILHLSHGHLTRFQDKITDKKEQKRANFAMDIAINQMIPEVKEKDSATPAIELPSFALKVTDFSYKDSTGKKMAFPLLKTAEDYYELMKNNECFMKMPQKSQDQHGKPEEGDGENSPVKPDKDGDVGMEDVLNAGQTKTLDEHKWSEMSEEDKQKMLQAARDLFQRAIDKCGNGKSDIPGFVNDLIKELDSKLTNINYKQILKQALKKTITCPDRTNTWKRPSKRYGTYSPGTENGKLPNIHFYQDTSGSMSYREICEFFNIIDQFTKIGPKKINLGFWHTVLYKLKKYRNVKDVKQDDIQSGGTDVSQVLHHIKKTRPNLAIILTDGEYYHDSTKIEDVEIIWIISKGGSVEHPLKKSHGKTIGLKGILDAS